MSLSSSSRASVRDGSVNYLLITMDSIAMAASSSDESSYGPSTGPTTPEWSPYLPPQRADRSFDSRAASLGGARASFSTLGLGPAALSNTPESELNVRNVCVIGAGYVGKSGYSLRRRVLTFLERRSHCRNSCTSQPLGRGYSA